MRFKWIIVLVVAAGVIGGIWWAVHRAVQPPPQTEEIRTAAVERGAIRVVIEATGSVESNLDVAIKCKASGEVVSIQYDVSDRVPKYVEGLNDLEALLVQLDPIDEQRNVERAQAQQEAAQARLDQATQNLAVARERLRTTALDAEARIAAAQARLDLARLQLDRVRQLLQRGAATQDELDTADANAKITEADLHAAQAYAETLEELRQVVQLRQADVALAKADLARSAVDLADARQRLTDTKIYSPIDGVITSRDVEIGQIVASGIVTVGGGTTMMTVSDLSRLFVMAAVDESDIGRLVETGRLGQSVVITTDSYPGRQFRGQVIQITPRGESEAKVVTFAVKIEVLDEDKNLLLPKMTADVEILADEKPDVLLVPLAAVRFEPGATLVDVQRGDGVEARAVRLGLNDGLQAEVLEGLTEGEQVRVGERSLTTWSNEGRAPRPATAPAEQEDAE